MTNSHDLLMALEEYERKSWENDVPFDTMRHLRKVVQHFEHVHAEICPQCDAVALDDALDDGEITESQYFAARGRL